MVVVVVAVVDDTVDDNLDTDDRLSKGGAYFCTRRSVPSCVRIMRLVDTNGRVLMVTKATLWTTRRVATGSNTGNTGRNTERPL